MGASDTVMVCKCQTCSHVHTVHCTNCTKSFTNHLSQSSNIAAKSETSQLSLSYLHRTVASSYVQELVYQLLIDKGLPWREQQRHWHPFTEGINVKCFARYTCKLHFCFWPDHYYLKCFLRPSWKLLNPASCTTALLRVSRMNRTNQASNS